MVLNSPKFKIAGHEAAHDIRFHWKPIDRLIIGFCPLVGLSERRCGNWESSDGKHTNIIPSLSQKSFIYKKNNIMRIKIILLK